MLKSCLGILLLLILVPYLNGQVDEQQNVVDLYLLLPETQFTKPDLDKWRGMSTRQYRESAIKVRDVKNGYLRIEEPVREGWAEVAIFRQTTPTYVVGISEVDCGPGCVGTIKFLQYIRGSELGWYDMTSTVMPEISKARIRAAYKRHRLADDSGELVYVLPRIGTTIKVQNTGDYHDVDFKPVVLFELSWNGTRFVLRDR